MNLEIDPASIADAMRVEAMNDRERDFREMMSPVPPPLTMEQAAETVARAMKIVRLLAEYQTIVDGTYANGNDTCIFCGSGNNPHYLGLESPVSEHDAECPWRMAKELVAAAGP